MIRVRDGGSFATRIVNVLQENKIIFTMTASFHRPEPGPEFQIPASELRAVVKYSLESQNMSVSSSPHRKIGLPLPDELVSTHGPPTTFGSPFGSIERVNVAVGDRWQMWWARYNGPTVIDASDWRLHHAIILFLSDFSMVETVTQPHADIEFPMRMSLDHAFYFHRPVDATQWLLFHIETNVSAQARGLARGSVFTQSGTLVASIAQEGLVRQARDVAPRTAPVSRL